MFVGALFLIAASAVVRGRDLSSAVSEAASWAAIGAVIFAVWDRYRLKRGQDCAVCDGPRIRGRVFDGREAHWC